jgi:hypothetical protein
VLAAVALVALIVLHVLTTVRQGWRMSWHVSSLTQAAE